MPLASIVGAIIIIETALILWHGYGATVTPVHDVTAGAGVGGGAMMSNTGLIGKVIYTDYIFAFEIAGLILLVAIIAAISLTIREKKDNKRQKIGDQVKVRASDRVRIVKMKSENGSARRDDQSSRDRQCRCGHGRQQRLSGKERRKMLSLAHYLVLGAILFAISIVGIFLNRRNVIIILMAIELMLLAVNTNFVAFSHYLGDVHGQIFVFFVLTVAAAEAAIGLAILVTLFRSLDTINVEDLDQLKG